MMAMYSNLKLSYLGHEGDFCAVQAVRSVLVRNLEHNSGSAEKCKNCRRVDFTEVLCLS